MEKPELSTGWYCAKIKAIHKALKVANNPYALPEEDTVNLLRSIRYELAHISNRIAADIKAWDDAERAARSKE